jgi:hypothetical protein
MRLLYRRKSRIRRSLGFVGHSSSSTARRPLQRLEIKCTAQQVLPRGVSREGTDYLTGPFRTPSFDGRAHWCQRDGCQHRSLKAVEYPGCIEIGPVAQRLEQWTHNPLVQGSNPCGPTKPLAMRRGRPVGESSESGVRPTSVDLTVRAETLCSRRINQLEPPVAQQH